MEWILNTIAGGFTSWKTTLTALVAAVCILLKQFGIVDITGAEQSTIVAFALLVIGWLAKDAGVSGKPLSEND